MSADQRVGAILAGAGLMALIILTVIVAVSAFIDYRERRACERELRAARLAQAAGRRR